MDTAGTRDPASYATTAYAAMAGLGGTRVPRILHAAQADTVCKPEKSILAGELVQLPHICCR
eukprot:4570043-Pleurochrysis_carterae.AAC.1